MSDNKEEVKLPPFFLPPRTISLSTEDIIIRFDEINKVINIMNEAKQVIFDPRKMSYFIDNNEFSLQFLCETTLKFSQYISSVNAALLKTNLLTPEEFEELKQKMEEKQKKMNSMTATSSGSVISTSVDISGSENATEKNN